MKSGIKKLISAGDGNNDIFSESVDMRLLYGCAVQWVITGTPVGASAKLQGSIDEVTWFDIDSQVFAAAGSHGANKDALYWPYVRLAWINGTTAAAVVNAWISTKG